MQLGKYETRQGRIVDLYERFVARDMRGGKVIDIERYRGKLLKANGLVENTLVYEPEPTGKPLARHIPTPPQRLSGSGEFDLTRMVHANEIQPLILTFENILEAAGGRAELRALIEDCATPEQFALKVIRNQAELLKVMVDDAASSASEHRRRKTA